MLKRDSLGNKIAVNHRDNSWKTEDGSLLFVQLWEPERNMRGVINLIHSLGEHSGRYAKWAARLADEGFVVRAFDLRGHGRSSGKRGHASNYNKLIRDVGQFVDQAREEYPGLPVFLYGHSFGANLILNYMIRHVNNLDGIIITSPWFESIRTFSKLMISLYTYLSILVPGILLHNRIKLEDLSRDLRVVHSYRTDPLIHDRISLRLLIDNYQAGKQASTSIYKINSPMLVMHGTEDHVTSCKASRKFVQNAGNKTRFIEWPGCYHELHNDMDKDEVFKSILQWLDEYAQPERKRNA